MTLPDLALHLLFHGGSSQRRCAGDVAAGKEVEGDGGVAQSGEGGVEAQVGGGGWDGAPVETPAPLRRGSTLTFVPYSIAGT